MSASSPAVLRSEQGPPAHPAELKRAPSKRMLESLPHALLSEALRDLFRCRDVGGRGTYGYDSWFFRQEVRQAQDGTLLPLMTADAFQFSFKLV